ncbi:Protein DFG16 [Nakaseomyces bracarensis]|uniref:Protein DFG16 n=1 Tax=Nakaseomyces bracarensis TaxID=273131 RepID=A0ABR4NPT8_9SACH
MLFLNDSKHHNIAKSCDIYGCTDPIWPLSDIINTTLFTELNKTNEKYGEIVYSCFANLLSGGMISYVDNSTSTTIRNATVRSPLVYIQCQNNDIMNDPSLQAMINQLVPIISQSMQAKDITSSYPLVSADKFVLSIIMIAFAQTCICIAYWMLFAVVMLLPSDNHNRQNKFVLLYVVVNAIFEAIILRKSVFEVFRLQYYENYQNSDEYEHIIVNATGTIVVELVCSVLAHLNWLIIILYMYPNPNFSWLQRSIVPKVLRKGRTIVMSFGILLIVIDDTIFAAFLSHRDKPSLRLAYKILEIALYTIFAILIINFMCTNFAFALSTKVQEIGQANNKYDEVENYSRSEDINDDDNPQYFSYGRPYHYTFFRRLTSLNSRFWRFITKNSIRTYYQLKVLWAEYQDIIPLLVYNIVLFFLSYWLTIFLNTGKYYRRRWAYNVVYFLRALITVNVWALIGVLEKKELIVSKKTVLGRQINSVSFTDNEDSDSIFGSIKEFNNNHFSKNNNNSGHTRELTRPDDESIENDETQYISDMNTFHSVIEEPTASSRSPIRRLRYFRRRKKL